MNDNDKKPNNNVVSFGEATGDSRHVSPVQLLRHCIDQIESGEFPAKKAVVLLVGTETNMMDSLLLNSGMHMFEIAAHLDLTKSQIHLSMLAAEE